MKLPCAVVRDLLPLFAENMTEPETQSLIEEHMRECQECHQKYDEIKTETTVAADTVKAATTPLLMLKKEIRKRRWFAALIAGLLVFVIAVTYVYHADSLKPVQWEEGLVTVKGIEEITPDNHSGHQHHEIVSSEPISPGEYTGNALILEFSSRIRGTETEHIEEDGTVTVILQGFGRSSSLSQETFSPGGEIMFCPVPDRVLYGYEGPQALLWGEPLDGGVEVLPRLALSYYVIIAVVAAVFTGIIWITVRKKHWSRIVRQVFFAPVAYILAHLLIMGFRVSSFFITRDFCFIILTACALYALISLLWQVLLQQKKAV